MSVSARANLSIWGDVSLPFRDALVRYFRKATPTLVRGRRPRVRMLASARPADLRCPRARDTRSDRRFEDDVEPVFVFVAFRRFAQFSGNEHQRADSGEEKACRYYHDAN